MDTRFLESFVAVVECGSIAEAARRLDLTAAAVAQRLRTLERELEIRLVTRSGRSVKPTLSGAAMLAHARSLLRNVRDLASLARMNVPSGVLRLGAVATAISGLLPEILPRVVARYPQIEVYVRPGLSAGLYQAVLDGDLDAAIIAKPPFAIPKACDWRLFREEPLVVLAPAATSVRNPRTLLETEPFIRYDRNSWGGRLVDGYLRRARIRPRDRLELDALQAIAVFVDRGLGVSLVPDWPPPWPEGLSIIKLPVHDPVSNRHMGLIWMRASVRASLVQAFLGAAEASPVIRPNMPPGRAAPRKVRPSK
jgi:DNA-binding transcriptional LysR family regulator